MTPEPVVIPDKIYFKIGEVCDLVGVQAHVLRYWETEFSVLSPQKNKSGQRSYRRRDVEIALRIKQLLYNEMFTIAGARKKLQSEQRDGSRQPTAAPAATKEPKTDKVEAPMLFDTSVEMIGDDPKAMSGRIFDGDQSEALKALAGHLLDLREMLRKSPFS